MMYRSRQWPKTTAISLLAGAIGCAFVPPVSTAKAADFSEKVVWVFNREKDGLGPASGLTNSNGTLYGTTMFGGRHHAGPGTVYSFNPSTGEEKVLYSFCSQPNCVDGEWPVAGLIEVKGTLYGTTASGGSGQVGTVFALDPKTGVEQVLHSFCSQQNCADGDHLDTSLIDVGGILYGTTRAGGTGAYCACGTVFSINPNTGEENVLYSFCSQQNCADGADPEGTLIDVKGTLYGVTITGGGLGYGAVFRVDPDTGAEQVLHSFGTPSDGRGPAGSLIDVNDTLYGITLGGGTSAYCLGSGGCGTTFSIDPGTGEERVIYSFCRQQNCTDGEEPYAGLINVKGMLYGVTLAGGSVNCNYGASCGTAFSIDSSTGVEKVLHSFCILRNCRDGRQPESVLINVNGVLYGTTNYGGGIRDFGTVFALTPKL